MNLFLMSGVQLSLLRHPRGAQNDQFVLKIQPECTSVEVDYKSCHQVDLTPPLYDALGTVSRNQSQ